MLLWLVLAGLAGPTGVACNATPEVEQTPETPSIAAHSWAANRTDNGTILGMEQPSAWSIATPGATLAQSTTHTQGSFSMAVRRSNTNGFTPLKSVAMTTLEVVSPTLAVDIRLPTYQPNPNWLGTAQAYVDCPSRGIYSQFLGQVEMTGKPLNTWFTVNFALTADQVSRLLQAGYSDLSISVILNVQVPTTGTYLVDNVRFIPVASNKCGGMPNGTACASGLCQGGVCVAPATPTNVRATPSAINAGGSSTLSATSPTTGATLLWYAGSACAGNSIATGTSVATGALTSTSTFSVRAQYGQAFSSCASVTVTVLAPAPVITSQPTNVTASLGESATFSVAAIGATAYQWYRNDEIIPGATTPTYTIASVTSADVAAYDCMVSNGPARVFSNVATLTLQ